MNKLKKWFKENITATDWIALFILLLAVVGIFYLPHWVTQKSWKYDLGETESNEIADTIGGILGPFISFISSCFVYLALREQVKANRLIGYQFLEQKNEKFERVIYEEVLSEINSIISNFERFDGNSFQIESHEPALSKEEIVAKLYQNVIYEEKTKISNDSETNLFSKNLIKLVEVLELFNSNIQNEKAFLQIIKLRIDKIYEFWNFTELIKERNDIARLKYKPSLILKLSKSRNFELIIRLLKVEKKLLKKLEDEKLELVSKQLEWYEKQFEKLCAKLSFQKTLSSIYTASFSNEENKRRDNKFMKQSKEEYEKYTNLLETAKKEKEKEFKAFLLEIKELSQKEEEVKYNFLDELIRNPYQTF